MPARPGPAVLVIARSGRALAASLGRAGHVCDVIDEYADADTRTLSRFCRAVERLDRDCLEPALRAWQAQAGANAMILPGSGFETNPDSLAMLSRFAPVAANTPAVVRAVKQPAGLAQTLDRLGIPRPAMTRNAAAGDGWLVKRTAADGGGHVRRWQPGAAIHEDEYLQERLPGQTVAALVLAGDGGVRIHGYSRNLQAGAQTGNRDDCRYAGAVRWRLPAALAAVIEPALTALCRATGLRGLCGIDMRINAAAGTFRVLEVNPRPPASFEVHEGGVSLAQAHIDACRGCLPDVDTVKAYPGLLVVYTPGPLRMPPGFDWPGWAADRPSAGQRLAAGTPLCTLSAHERTPAASYRRLLARRQKVLNDIKLKIQSIDSEKEVTV